MIVKQTLDIAEIKKILCHPEIFKRISDDYSIPINEFEPPLECEYIAGYVNSNIIGLMIYNKVNERVKCHFQVLPEFRFKYSRQFVRMALDIGKAKNASIYAEIPNCYPEVVNFAKKSGFKIVGKIVNSCKKSGLFYDDIILRL